MIARVRPPHTTPLEIWALELPGRDGRLVDRIGAARAATLDDHALTGEILDVLASLPIGRDRVFLGGGLVDRPLLRAALSRVPALHLAPHGRFAGEPGGVALLRERGHAAGAVVDVGQTATKISLVHGDGSITRRVVDRDDARPIPALPGVPALVLALPCEIDDRCALGPCTYANLSLPDDLPAATYLLNDAELVALSAPPLPGRTLVVTLGFGPGAALIDRPPFRGAR